MTLPAIETSYTLPPLYHRHVWRVKAVGKDEDDIVNSDVIAQCDDCPAEMTKFQIEAILNGWTVLADE